MKIISIPKLATATVAAIGTCHQGSGNCNCGGSGCQRCVAGSVENFYLQLKNRKQ